MLQEESTVNSSDNKMPALRERLAVMPRSVWHFMRNSIKFEALKQDDVDDIEEGKPTTTDIAKTDASCLKISVISTVVVTVICIVCFIGRDSIRQLLVWMEHADIWITMLIFAILFTAVSFPMAWGYVLLNVAVGYLYGVTNGMILVTVCALIGLSVAHIVIRKCMSEYVMSKLMNDNMRALVRVVESDRGFKIIVLARLTPIPFGLQNALFAISEVKTLNYLSASILGLLPTQGLNAYIGSTLRSMEEVLSDSSNTLTGYIVFFSQLALTIGLMVYVAKRAKMEFNKTLEAQEQGGTSPSPSSSSSSSTSGDENSNNCQNGGVIKEQEQKNRYTLLPNSISDFFNTFKNKQDHNEEGQR